MPIPLFPQRRLGRCVAAHHMGHSAAGRPGFGPQGQRLLSMNVVKMMAPRMMAALTLWAACVAAPAQGQEDTKPKFGPEAVPITRAADYVRTALAPDYWALSPFYVPQATGSACSLASVTMMLNALRGLPGLASDRLVTQKQLLDAVGDDEWRRAVAEDGEGVSFTELELYVRRSLDAYGLSGAEVEVFRPRDSSPQTLAELRRILKENEQSDGDIILVAYDQGTLTGDVGYGHIAPLGAYDAATRRVLMMDPDRSWYVPYWSSDVKLLEAMLKPDRADPEGSGLIRVRARRVSG